MLLEFDKIYDTLSVEKKREILHSLISEIQLYNKAHHFYLHLPVEETKLRKNLE